MNIVMKGSRVRDKRANVKRARLVEAFFQCSLSGLLRYDIAIPWGDELFTGIIFLRGAAGVVYMVCLPAQSGSWSRISPLPMDANWGSGQIFRLRIGTVQARVFRIAEIMCAYYQ